MHEHYGKWNSVYVRFRRWAEQGIWDALLETLVELGPTDNWLHMIDSTTVRGHSVRAVCGCFAGAGAQAGQYRWRAGGIKAGRSADEIWPDELAKVAQNDADARWTLKIGGKVDYREDGTPLPIIAIPVFGYKSHISIDRCYGFIRAAAVTSARHPDSRMLRQVIDRENTGNEAWLAATMQPDTGASPRAS